MKRLMKKIAGFNVQNLINIEFWQYCFKLTRLVFMRFSEEKFTYRASALTYTTLLALVPLTTVMLSILSAFPVFTSKGTDIQDFIFQNFVPASSEVIQSYLISFAQQTARLSLVGTGMLIVTSVMLLLTIENSLNTIWHVKVGRRGMAALLRYWAVLSLAPIFIGISFGITSYVFSLSFVSTATSVWGIKKLLLALLPFMLTFIGFTVLYTLVPNCRVKLRYGVIGGFIAAILFECTKRAFALYVIHFPTYKLVYGAFAVIPLFLVWIFLSWTIILLGASISHTVATVERTGKGSRIDGFTHAFIWLGLLWEAQNEGLELSLTTLLRKAPGHYQEDPESLMHALIDAGFIKGTENGGYVLARYGENIMMQALYERLPFDLPDDAQASKMEGLGYTKYGALLKAANKDLGRHLNVSIVSLYEPR